MSGSVRQCLSSMARILRTSFPNLKAEVGTFPEGFDSGKCTAVSRGCVQLPNDLLLGQGKNHSISLSTRDKHGSAFGFSQLTRYLAILIHHQSNTTITYGFPSVGLRFMCTRLIGDFRVKVPLWRGSELLVRYHTWPQITFNDTIPHRLLNEHLFQ